MKIFKLFNIDLSKPMTEYIETQITDQEWEEFAYEVECAYDWYNKLDDVIAKSSIFIARLKLHDIDWIWDHTIDYFDGSRFTLDIKQVEKSMLEIDDITKEEVKHAIFIIQDIYNQINHI